MAVTPKTVYRVRTQTNINGRIALDMQREERTQHREQTTKTLHTARPRTAEGRLIVCNDATGSKKR